jgi:hypothetical protein
MAKKQPDSRLELEVNEYKLTGEKRKGKWTFTCDSWPDLAEMCSGKTSFEEAASLFMSRVLILATTIKEL